MSRSSSTSSSSMTLNAGAAAITSSSTISKGFSCKLPSFKFSVCAWSKALPPAHFLPSLKHEIKSSSVLSTANGAFIKFFEFLGGRLFEGAFIEKSPKKGASIREGRLKEGGV